MTKDSVPLISHATTGFHNTTENVTSVTNPHNDSMDTGQGGANAAVAIISVIVIGTIFLMTLYFVFKFKQLNRMVPSYRYSSLKTEINGISGSEGSESQALVSGSTEEEDDFDDEEFPSPPTLKVQSQTASSNNRSQNIASFMSKVPRPASIPEIKETLVVDSDDELLQ